MFTSFLTPAAAAREVERLRVMAKRAEDRPVGYTREAWAKRCAKLAAYYAEQARRDAH